MLTLQDSGIWPLSRIKLNNLKYIGINVEHDTLMYSFIMSSIPGHFPFFNFFNHFIISYSDISQFNISESKLLALISPSTTSSCSILFRVLKKPCKASSFMSGLLGFVFKLLT